MNVISHILTFIIGYILGVFCLFWLSTDSMEWEFLWLGFFLGALMHRLLVIRKLKCLNAETSILLKKADEAIKNSDEITKKSEQTLKKIESMYDFSNN